MRLLLAICAVGALLSGCTQSPPLQRGDRTSGTIDFDRVEYEPPLVISEGGTYEGAWESQQPDVPAMTIDTTEPVIIEHSYVRGRGDLVRQGVDGVDVTIRDSYALGLNPDQDGAEVGRFVNIENARRVVLEHNHLESTAGIRFLGYTGAHAPEHTFRVVGNRVRNIDGRLSNGSGDAGAAGFYPEEGDGSVRLTQFVQLDKVRGVPGIEIAWNDVLNEPDGSRVEDNISVFLSSGTPDSPINIHDNFIEGAYPLQPEENEFSGGGIMLGDGDAADPQGAPSHAVATANTVINTTNYGIAIASGHGLSFHGNRMLSTGLLPDGTPVAAQNVGAYVWDSERGSGVFFGNEARNNVVGWETPLEGGRNDLFLPDNSGDGTNQSFSGEVTKATLDEEFDRWRERTEQAGIRPGPRS